MATRGGEEEGAEEAAPATAAPPLPLSDGLLGSRVADLDLQDLRVHRGEPARKLRSRDIVQVEHGAHAPRAHI